MKVCQLRSHFVAVSVSLLTAATVSAQGQMKVDTGSGGGKDAFIAPCLARVSAGSAGPVARAVWQMVKPGTINYCVHAGADGDFKVSANSPPMIALRTDPAPLGLTISLHDWRSGSDERWIESLEGKTRPRAEITSTTHTTHISRSASLTESIPSGSLNMLPSAWCSTNQSWGSRPKLVVKLSGPALRGRDTGTDWANVCEVSFGPPESPNVALPTVLGVPAYSARSLTPASQMKPSPTMPKSTP